MSKKLKSTIPDPKDETIKSIKSKSELEEIHLNSSTDLQSI
jgi:hypothetical protein